MQFIPLFKQGAVVDYAIVDDEDFELLDEFKWHRSASGYAYTAIRIGKMRVQPLMHRIILNAPNGVDTDHIEHDTLDNRKSNLRIATRSQNKQNGFGWANKAFKGVSWYKRYRKWAARIGLPGTSGKNKFLGYFEDATEAALAYNAAAREMFGEFACLNQVLQTGPPSYPIEASGPRYGPTIAGLGVETKPQCSTVS